MLKASLIVVLSVLALASVSVSAKDQCKMEWGVYPPPEDTVIPWATVNLDLPAEQRWADLATQKKSDIQAMLGEILDILPESIVEWLQNQSGNHTDGYLDRFPNDWGDEIRGIAQVTNITESELFIFNIAYELMGLCTSVVVDNDGHIMHGRNLDFGLFLGWNKSEKTWEMPQLLRNLLVNVDFQRGGKSIYKTVTYVGYIGVHTGYMPGGFSLTVDTRFDNNFDRYLIKWLEDPTDTDQFLTLTTRWCFENVDNYADAVEKMSNTALVGPGYTIIGGINAGEGVVITLGPHNDTALNVWPISKGMPTDNPWYVLETNYDHWVNPPFYDNRRTPTEDCLADLGMEALNFTSLYTVMHGTPTRNQLTTFTVLFDTKAAKMESYLEYCWPEEEKGCALF